MKNQLEKWTRSGCINEMKSQGNIGWRRKNSLPDEWSVFLYGSIEKEKEEALWLGTGREQLIKCLSIVRLMSNRNRLRPPPKIIFADLKSPAIGERLAVELRELRNRVAPCIQPLL
jgi:hypothetical protein